MKTLIQTSKTILPLLFLSLFLASCAPGEITIGGEIQPVKTATKTPETTPEVDSILTETPAPVAITAETITIAHLGNATGAGSEFVQPKIRGVQDMVNQINQQGGVGGAELELVFIDTLGGSAEEVFAALTESSSPLILVLYDWRDALAVQPLAKEAGMPIILIDSPAEPAENLFAMLPTLPDQLGFFMGYAAAHWDEIKPAGAEDQIKLAYISWPESVAPDALTSENRRLLQQLGIELVLEEQINPSYAEDTQPIVNKMKREEVNLMYTNTWAYGPAILLNDLHWLKMDTVITVAGPNQALDATTYAYLINRDDFNGFYGPMVSLWWSDSGQRAVEFARTNFAQNDRTAADETLGRLLAQAAVDLIRQVILLNAQSGRTLTAENLLLTLNALPETRLLDGLMQVNFSSGVHTPTQMQIRRVDGMLNFVGISDYLPLNDR